MRDTLVDSISQGALREDNTIQQINLSILDAMEQMNKRLGVLESKVEKVDQHIASRFKAQDEKVDEHSIILDTQFDAIQSLSMQARLLEGVALGVCHFYLQTVLIFFC